MHLRTVAEIALHLQSFRNIELWYQGVYFLKITMYQEKENNKKNYAQPYAITQTNITGKSTEKSYDSQIVGLSSIVRNQSAFYTKAVHLRYFQQQVEIGDICRWRIEVETFQGQKNQNKLSQKNGSDKKQTELIIEIGLYFYDSFKKQQSQTMNDWRTNSKQVRQIKMVMPFSTKQPQFINSYMPVLFTDQYFSLTSTSLHFMTIDYKFRMNDISLSEFASWSEEEKKKKIKQMILSKNNQILSTESRNSNKKGGVIFEYMKRRFCAENGKIVVDKMVAMLKCIAVLSQDIIKEYGKVYDFVMTEDLYMHPKIGQVISPDKLQLPLQKIKEIVKQEQSLLVQNKTLPDSTNYEDIVMTIFNKISYIGHINSELFHCFMNLIKLNSLFSIRLYSKNYYQKQKDFYLKLTKINSITYQNVAQKQQNKHIDIAIRNNRTNNKLLKELEKQRSNLKLQTKIIDYQLKTKLNELPLLVVEKFTQNFVENRNQLKKVSQISKSQHQFSGLHLIVLVHGFQGTSYDMKMIKNHLSHLYPESMFLCCTSNQDRTDQDIFQMGNRLAVQIKAFILQNFNINNNITPSNINGMLLKRISFIGHSLGGLKIRAALPKLLQYKGLFQNFITLSSPHLGYNVNTSSVVDAGLWVLQKIKDSLCLRQLKMMDQSSLHDTALYKLSLQQGLEHFKNIFLFSSSQDSYAPYESARIEIDPQFVDHNDKIKSIHCQMVRNILKNVSKQSLNRIDVNFTINNKNLDAFIGRTAHIMFLQNAQLIKTFSYLNQGIFS